MSKKIVILILIAAVLIIAGGILVFKPFSSKGPVWVSSEKLINKGDIAQPGKILEIIFDYDKNASPPLAIRKLAIKNGFPPAQQGQEKEYTLKIYDAGSTVIKSQLFGPPLEEADVVQDPSVMGKVSFIIISDWFASADRLEVIDASGTAIISKKLENIPALDNKPGFKTLNFNTIQEPGPASLLDSALFSIPQASASGDGYLDIVFVGEKFASVAAMESEINTYKNKLETIEPFKSRESQLRYSHINIFDGGYCVMNQGEEFPSCDLVAVEQAVNDASVPADKIVILLNNDSGSFDGALFTGFSKMAARCCEAVIGKLGSDIVFVHEIGHLLGGLADEYQISNPNPPNAGNCYEDSTLPNPEWQDMVALRDYRQRCSRPDWYRSYEISIMDNTPTIDYFNAPSQKILNKEFDTFSGPFTNSNEPSASITSPASGANLSGVVTVKTSLTDDLGIARANLYVNGEFYQTAYKTPFSFSWNTAEFNNGSYELEVEAFDVPGNTKKAKITVNVSNSSSGEDGLKVTVKEGSDEGNNKIYLAAGTYSVTEDKTTNWDFSSATCVLEGGSQTGSSVTSGTSGVKVEAGKKTVCTFENIFNDKGAIKVIKKSIGANETFSFDSNFGVGSLTTTAANNGTASQTIPNLQAGSNYYISETDIPDGWELSSLSCDNGFSETQDGKGLEDINVTPGETTTCTFTNTYSACIDTGGDEGIPFSE